MEIKVYDEKLELKGFLETASSIQWERSYYDTGSFQIVCPLNDYNVQLLTRESILRLPNAKEAGVIEGVTLEVKKNKRKLTIKGRFLSSYLDRRIVKETYYANNKKYEAIMHELVENMIPIPLLKNRESVGYESTVTMQATYKSVLDVMSKLSQASNIAFRIVPDFENKQLFFETYQGIDRTVNQSDRTRIVFSDEYANLRDMVYTENSKTMKNVCYVGGEKPTNDDGTEGKRKVVVVGDTDATGLELRESFLSATVTKNENMTESDYLEALRQKGREKLETVKLVQSINSVIGQYGNFVYKQDYDLGDIVTVSKPTWGIFEDLRITKVKEIYEQDGAKCEITLGNPLPTKFDWSKYE